MLTALFDGIIGVGRACDCSATNIVIVINFNRLERLYVWMSAGFFFQQETKLGTGDGYTVFCIFLTQFPTVRIMMGRGGCSKPQNIQYY